MRKYGKYFDMKLFKPTHSIKKLFQFQQISPYLVAISKVETEIVTGVTGIVVAMFDKKYGKLLFWYICDFSGKGLLNNYRMLK